MLISEVIEKAQEAVVSTVVERFIVRQAGFEPGGLRCSSTGYCHRKVLLRELVETGVEFTDSNYIREIYTAHLRDPSFVGLMEKGDEEHERIQKIWDFHMLLFVGDKVSREEMIDDYLRTRYQFGQEMDPLFTVEGLGDSILSNVLKGGEHLWVDIKSCNSTVADIFEDQADEIGNIKVVSPRLKDAAQVAMYFQGRSKKARALKMSPIPYVFYTCKDDYRGFWAPVDMDHWGPWAVGYWLNHNDAKTEFERTGQLPPPKPIEAWECQWGRKGKKKCEYYEICKREKEGLKHVKRSASKEE